MKKQSFSQFLDLSIETLQEKLEKGTKVSKKDKAKLRTMHGLVLNLCPDSAGLPIKDRIKREPEGDTKEEMKESMVNIVYDEFPYLTNNGKEFITQRSAKFISQTYWFKGLTSSEVYTTLKNENRKNYDK